NASHFGIQVASSEDVAAAWARFKGAGLSTRTEENTSCCYALQDKVWVKDPDGNEWEVFVVKGDTDRMSDDPKATSCCAPAEKAKGSGGCCG
ncbi:MAG TPA: VOC family protein, partial [Labilithrix sp.]